MSIKYDSEHWDKRCSEEEWATFLELVEKKEAIQKAVEKEEP